MIFEIYIIGAGGFGKEVAFLISDINREEKRYNIAGFIDKKNENKKINVCGEDIPIIEEEIILKKREKKNVAIAVGIGNPDLIEKILKNYKDKKFHFPNLIHPNFIGDLENINMGKGNIITAGNIFTTSIKIGDFNIFNLNVTIGHDCNIGNHNVINPGVNISGGVEIKDLNLFGTNSTVLQYKKIGSGNIIGASGLVNKDIGNNNVMVGIPVRFVKNVI